MTSCWSMEFWMRGTACIYSAYMFPSTVRQRGTNSQCRGSSRFQQMLITSNPAAEFSCKCCTMVLWEGQSWASDVLALGMSSTSWRRDSVSVDDDVSTWTCLQSWCSQTCISWTTSLQFCHLLFFQLALCKFHVQCFRRTLTTTLRSAIFYFIKFMGSWHARLHQNDIQNTVLHDVQRLCWFWGRKSGNLKI